MARTPVLLLGQTCSLATPHEAMTETFMQPTPRKHSRVSSWRPSNGIANKETTRGGDTATHASTATHGRRQPTTVVSQHQQHTRKCKHLTQQTWQHPNTLPLTMQVQLLQLRQLGQRWRQCLCSICAKRVPWQRTTVMTDRTSRSQQHE